MTDTAPFIDREGRPRSWQEVHTHLQRLLLKRYGRTVDRDIIEDSVSDALVDLISYWQGLQSSQVAKQLNFGYALLRGMHTGKTSIRAEVRRLDTVRPMGARDGGGHGDMCDAIGFADDEAQGADYLADTADPALGPEELALAQDEMERARQMLSSLSAEALAECFELLEGGSTRVLAERLGVSHMTVARRKHNATATVQALAPGFGLT